MDYYVQDGEMVRNYLVINNPESFTIERISEILQLHDSYLLKKEPVTDDLDDIPDGVGFWVIDQARMFQTNFGFFDIYEIMMPEVTWPVFHFENTPYIVALYHKAILYGGICAVVAKDLITGR